MKAMAIMDIQGETFRTVSEHRGDAIVVRMCGNADIQAHDPLKLFLDALGAEAKRLLVKETTFDLEELYFMNSSCLSLLLRHINAVIEMGTSKPYRLRFRANPNLRWQRRSLQALRSYSPDLVIVE